MLKALANVAPRHLLDTRLNPPAELRARVGQEGREGRERQDGKRRTEVLPVPPVLPLLPVQPS